MKENSKNIILMNMEFLPNELISVIIPTYNRAHCLERSVRSVLNQTYNNLELIIVDDCSIDNTESLVKGMNDSRIKYVRMDKNGGPSKARNVGVKIACGEYIAFQDSDDEWHPDKLEKQYALMKSNPDCLMVFSKFKIVCNEPKVIPSENSFPTDNKQFFNILLNENKVSTQTIFVRKSAFDAVDGFNENIVTLEDWEFALKIAYSGKIMYVNEALVDVYYSEDGVNSSNSKKKVRSLIAILMTYFPRFQDKSIFYRLLYNIVFQFQNMSCDEKKSFFENLDKIVPGGLIIFQILDEINKERDSLARHLKKLDAEIDMLRARVNELNSNVGNLESVIANKNAEASDLASRNQVLNSSLDFERKKKTMMKKAFSLFFAGQLVNKLCLCENARVSFYGAGEVAQVLVPLCKMAGLNVLFTIDRNPKVLDGILSYSISDVPEKNVPVIITAYDPERTIIEDLRKRMDGPVYYLDELLAD